MAIYSEYDNPYTAHTEAARLVAAHGGTLSKEWLAIDNNYDAYHYASTDYAADLADAVISGADASTLSDLRALAMAAMVGSQTGSDKHTVGGTAEASIRNSVRERVTMALKTEYARSCQGNLKAVGARLSEGIAELTELSKSVDINADPSALIGTSSKVQSAWMRAGDVAHEVEKTFSAFRAAVALEGRNLVKQDQLISLVCPTDGIGDDRRALWNAWDDKGRTGRFGALVKAGVVLKPITSVREYVAYARPESETVFTRGAMGSMQQFVVDTESGNPVE